jgi:RNA polymerase sigma-70 factor, ECF subfamily
VHIWDVDGKQDVTSFGELYRTYSAVVYRYGLALTSGRRQDAEDLVSETFLRVWSSAQPLRLPTVRSYLMAITRNLFLESLRKRRHERPLDFDVAGASDLASDSESRQQWAALREALPLLKDEHREPLLLQVWAGLSYNEISAILQVPAATLKVRVHRARLELARMIYREVEK